MRPALPGQLTSDSSFLRRLRSPEITSDQLRWAKAWAKVLVWTENRASWPVRFINSNQLQIPRIEQPDEFRTLRPRQPDYRAGRTPRRTTWRHSRRLGPLQRVSRDLGKAEQYPADRSL